MFQLNKKSFGSLTVPSFKTGVLKSLNIFLPLIFLGFCTWHELQSSLSNDTTATEKDILTDSTLLHYLRGINGNKYGPRPYLDCFETSGPVSRIMPVPVQGGDNVFAIDVDQNCETHLGGLTYIGNQKIPFYAKLDSRGEVIGNVQYFNGDIGSTIEKIEVDSENNPLLLLESNNTTYLKKLSSNESPSNFQPISSYFASNFIIDQMGDHYVLYRYVGGVRLAQYNSSGVQTNDWLVTTVVGSAEFYPAYLLVDSNNKLLLVGYVYDSPGDDFFRVSEIDTNTGIQTNVADIYAPESVLTFMTGASIDNNDNITISGNTYYLNPQPDKLYLTQIKRSGTTNFKKYINHPNINATFLNGTQNLTLGNSNNLSLISSIYTSADFGTLIQRYDGSGELLNSIESFEIKANMISMSPTGKPYVVGRQGVHNTRVMQINWPQ